MVKSSFEAPNSHKLLPLILLFEPKSDNRLTDKKCIQLSGIWIKANILFTERSLKTDLHISGSGFNPKLKHRRVVKYYKPERF